MKQVKIAIIGAGSGIFSINLIKDLCVNENLKDARLTLMDVDERRLDGIYSMCVRYAAEINHRLDVSKTTDRIEAITGADFVINVALDYGHARLREGWRVAMEHGYRFGGSLHVMHDEAFWVNFHQLRLMESIAQDVLRVCPKAWLVMVAPAIVSMPSTALAARIRPGSCSMAGSAMPLVSWGASTVTEAMRPFWIVRVTVTVPIPVA